MAEVMLAMSQRGPAKSNNNVGHHHATTSFSSMASILNHENMAAPTASLIDLLATKNIPARPGHVPLRSSMPMNVPANASRRPIISGNHPIHHHHHSSNMGSIMGYPQFPNIGAKKFILPAGITVAANVANHSIMHNKQPQHQQQQQTPMNHHVPPTWDFINTANTGNVVIHNNPQEQPPDHNVPSAQELIAAASNLTNSRVNNNTINGQLLRSPFPDLSRPTNTTMLHHLNTLRGPANTSPNMMDNNMASLPLPPTDLSRVSTGGSQELMTRVRELEDQLTRERLQARVRELEVEMSQRRQREGILRSVIDTAISSNRGTSLGRGRGGGGASSSSAGGHSSLAAAARSAAASAMARGHMNPSRGNAPGMQVNNNNLPPDGLWGLVSASMIHPSVQDTERAAMLSRMIEPRGGSAAATSTAHHHHRRRRQHHHHHGMSSRIQPTMCASSGSPLNSPERGLVNAASKKKQIR